VSFEFPEQKGGKGMYILGKFSFEAGRGRFLDFLGDFGVVCGVGDALAVGVLWCCAHFGLYQRFLIELG
jgi:hypothetical protein